MADNGPANPQPNPNEPWLEALTFEQVEQLVNEVSPDVFYQRASAFDQAGARLQDVLDQVRHEMNLVREAWTGTASDDFAALVRDVTAKVSGVLQFLQSPGYGATLRDAGDRLADHQRRLRDLAGQKAQQESAPPASGGPTPEQVAQANNDSAKQIMRDLRTAYWDIGNALPGFPYKPPAKEISDPNTVNPGNTDGNGNGQNNGAGQGNGGENSPWAGNPAPVVSNLYATGGPPGLTGPQRSNSTFVTSTHAPGGGERYRFDSGHGPGFQNEQVLGRADPNGQSQTAPGGGPGGPGPGLPAWPGQTFFAGGSTQGGDPVLGHRTAATRRPEPVAADADGETFAGVPHAVLGRPTVPTGQSEKDRKPTVSRPGIVEEPVDEHEAPSETVSAQTLAAPLHIRTAADAPVPVVRDEAVPAGLAVTADGTPVPPADPKPAVTLASEVDPVKPVMLSASHGGGGVTHAVSLDPSQRGLSAPGATTADGLDGQMPLAPSGSGQPTRADQNGTPGHMGGMPMSPMMLGGMAGGGMQQQGGRMAAMPNEPRPEVWDPATVAPVAVGRRARQEQDEHEPEQPLSKEQIQAALTEKFAELDRLSGRGKHGGK